MRRLSAVIEILKHRAPQPQAAKPASSALAGSSNALHSTPRPPLAPAATPRRAGRHQATKRRDRKCRKSKSSRRIRHAASDDLAAARAAGAEPLTSQTMSDAILASADQGGIAIAQASAASAAKPTT